MNRVRSANETRSGGAGTSHQVPGEPQLVARARAGDLVAYESLVRSNMRRTRAYLALRAPAVHLVDEIAHEAFVVAFQKIDKLHAGTPFFAWVRGIAFQILRRETKRFRLDANNRDRLIDHLSILEDQPVHETQLDGRIERLETCLGKVVGQMRRLLDLRYRDGMTSREIASEVGKTDDWVRTNLSRTRKQLRRCVEESGDGNQLPS